MDETSQKVPCPPPVPLAESQTQASVYAAGPAFLTCWVKAACGDVGDLLGAPRALSDFESQDLSLESGSRGVRARPKPSSVSAMVRPGSCARARFYSEDDRRESWRVSSDIGDSYLTLHSKLKEASLRKVFLLLYFPTTVAPPLAKYPLRTGRRWRGSPHLPCTGSG